MGGFSSVSGLETIMHADNASFDGTNRGGAMTTNGQFWIGSTALPHVRVGTITSPLGTISIGYSSPNITLDVVSGSSGIETIDGDSGSMTGTTVTISGGTTGLTTSASSATMNLTGTLNVGHGGTGSATLTGILTGNGTSAVTAKAITQYNVLTGGASNAPNSVAPSSTSGVPLISNGSSSYPSFGTTSIAGGGTNATSFGTTNGIVKFNGTSLAASTTALIDSNNIITNTSQPMLYAKVGSSLTNVTGDGTTPTIVYDTIVAQQGSNYNNSTGIFTCPTAGVYIVLANIGWNNIAPAHTRGQINLIMSGSASVDTQIEASPAACESSNSIYSQSANAISLMAAGGTINVAGFVAGFTKTVGVLGEDFGQYSSLYIAKLF